MFKELSSIPNLPEQEKNTIKFWQGLNIVEKLKNERLASKSSEKVYYDGPITANGLPHYGHALTWTMKDVIPRYWSMMGNLVYRNMGWDCQGIPVEYEVEKELGFEKKEDIEVFGVEKFNQLCRESVQKHQKAMFEYEERIGRWYDEKEIYSTMDASYIESIWWSLKELFNKGLLYEGYKVVAYSTRAGTTLSTHEVNDGGYKDIEDPWVMVKFKLKPDEAEIYQRIKKAVGKFEPEFKPDVYFLAWTTTPWTVPGNLMLSVGKNIKYVLVHSLGGHYILAEERLEEVFKDADGNGIPYLRIKDYEKNIDISFSSQDLIGLEYEPPFTNFEHKRSEGCFRILEAGHTNTDEGTGLVHLAPYGVEDFDVFMSKGIQVFDYLDETAHFTDLIPEYTGQFYKKANDNIISDLKNRDRLFSNGKIVHRMPMCWRTNTPLIYKPVKSWYVAVTKIKEKMIEQNQGLNWYPDHLKDGNSGIWIQNARDWALSRSRYWGTPLPVWVNDKTGEKVCIGSFSELKELSGIALTDPHKPFVDEISWEDTKNGGTFRRTKDVIDVWYDSGAMPFARFHYPFENKEKLKGTFPAEYISEGPDQVRLWFYVMHVLGVALFDQVPYKNVATIGTMLDENGKKLSKSKKNYKPMDEILDAYGGDVLRYFVLTSSIVSGSDAVFSEKFLSEAKKEFFLILWNSLKYFISYANLHSFKPELGFPKLVEPEKDSDKYEEYLLDKWILTRLKEVGLNILNNLETYHIMEAARTLQPFVNDLSTWYIRRSRDRIKDGDTNSLKTLYYVLVELAKYMAPFLPFISEEIYQTLEVGKLSEKDSVHLDLLTECETLNSDEIELLKKMAHTREVVSLALSLRVSEGVKVRQPLNSVYVMWKMLGGGKLTYMESLIKDEVNVKEVHLGVPENKEEFKVVENSDYAVYLDVRVTEELKKEGEARELVRKIQDLRKEKGLSIKDKIHVTVGNEHALLVEKFGEYLKAKTLAETVTVGESLDIKSL